MSKNKPDTTSLQNELKQSVFFQRREPVPQLPQVEAEESVDIVNNRTINIADNIVGNIAINIADNIQLTQKDIELLRQKPNDPRTFQFTQDEIDWLFDTAYILSQELGRRFGRRKVAQVDVLRLALVIFKKLLSTDSKPQLLKTLEEMR